MEFEYSATLKIVDKNSLEKQLTQPVRVFHLNRPPVPGFKIGTRLGNLTTQFYLDAWPTSDIDDLPTAIKVQWDFDGDESWDTEFSLEKYYYHRYNSPGTYKIILEAMDTPINPDQLPWIMSSIIFVPGKLPEPKHHR